MGAIGRCTNGAALWICSRQGPGVVVRSGGSSGGRHWCLQPRHHLDASAAAYGQLAAGHRDGSPAVPSAQSFADSSRQWADALVARPQLGGAPPPLAFNVDEAAWRTAPSLQGFAGVVESCGVALVGANAVGSVAISSGWPGILGRDAGDLGWWGVVGQAPGGGKQGLPEFPWLPATGQLKRRRW
jgi:hypothetical protein